VQGAARLINRECVLDSEWSVFPPSRKKVRARACARAARSMAADEDPNKVLADLGSALLRLPGEDHRVLLGSVARCLCTTMHTAHGGGNRVALALRLTAVLDLLLRQAGERDPASEAMLSSLVNQLEQWAQPVEGTAAAQTEMSPELAAARLSASVAEQREAITRQLQSEDSAVAAALQRRMADRAQPRGGSGASRWRTVVMGLVLPAAIIALSVLVHRFGHEMGLSRLLKG